MNLSHFSDQQLLDDIRELVNQEREMISVIVRYLGEIEARKLALGKGFPSLFAYCVEILGYSEAEAILRIRAARLIRDVSLALPALEDGRLSLSVAARAQSCFQREKELGQGVREDVVRELFGKKISEADRILATYFPQTPPRERKVPMDADQTKLEFTIPGFTREKMEKILCLRSHKNPAKRLDLLLDDLLNLALRTWDPAHPRRSRKYKEPTASLQ